MYLIRQCNMLQSQCNAAVLQKDLDRFKKEHPGEPEAKAVHLVHHAMKHVLPATIPWSPTWHYNALQDLLAMVDANAMPDLFWTVTMDEVVSKDYTKWESVKDMETLLKSLCTSCTFQDAPVECARSSVS
ncbi:hypothetical protein CEUSTIGMA_g5441.t1 [Chlamydomonas eustigma]|uniref:Uncharacterized protein n=1 Tax=Chlamydomonas eustigma TaxID=1157962 RepID=A0A250X505_9CHLO|nr:hypothetical protein CEUSTIGMA_g5441.t1 [Chlamydomonas eustigma]|eukprot:GAX77999.1 hypothetical protein CEUSTIGMA_g5441.t1 [Chlamydomonas eustigma]